MKHKILKGYFIEVKQIFQRSTKGVSRKIDGHLEGILRVFVEISKRIKECFKKVSKVFQRSFKSVSRKKRF